MAPITRSAGSARQEGFLISRPGHREGSWEFAGSEPPEGSSREASEEPENAAARLTSYDEEEDVDEDSEDRDDDPNDVTPDGLQSDLLHPLREAANRVGREVEKFAEALDGYNPLKAVDEVDRYESALEVIDVYYGIAVETVERLRGEISGASKRREDGAQWRNKMRGFKITQDIEDDMDMDDDESELALVPHGALTPADLRRWEQEAQTWDLLRRMALLQFKPPGYDDTSKPQPRPIHKYSSDRDTWNAFLITDDLAKEQYTVLKWLSQSAEESGEDIATLVQELQQNADRGEIIAHGWLHTKAAIKNQKRLHAWPHALDPSSAEVREKHLNASRTEPLVTQLDPDATTRQGRKLEAQDEYFERAIWLGCYELLRRGKSANEIKDWCKERTEIWRAVSMSGFLESGEPDEFAEPEDEDPREVNDSKSSALWRRMCYSLARNGGRDDFEKAVYGLLSGDVSSVEPVCQSWDDFLFAHYNALLRTQYEAYLQANFPDRIPSEIAQSFATFDAVQFHGNRETAARSLVDSLKLNPKTKNDATNPLKMLQGVLVSKYFDEYAYQQGLALAKYANEEEVSVLMPKLLNQPEREDLNTYITLEDFDSLRVLVHMLLALRNLGLDTVKGSNDREVAVDNIILAYCQFLRLSANEELIPLYAAQLSGERIYACLGHTLVTITDQDQRSVLISLIKDLGLDAQRYVRYQTRPLLVDKSATEGYPAKEKFKILENSSDRTTVGVKLKRGFIGEDVPEDDYLLIRSFEWFLLVDGMWSETFRTGIFMYLRFFKHMHLASARLLCDSVSSIDIAQAKIPTLLGEDVDLFDLANEDLEVDGTEDEEEVQAKLIKRQMLKETKLFRDLEALIDVLDHLETVDTIVKSLAATVQESSRKKNLRLDLGRALSSMSDLMSILLAPEWLVDAGEEVAEDCKLLRETYLPQVILGYLASLNAGGCMTSRSYLLEGINLSTIIADDASSLSELFVSTGYMPKLVEAFARLSKAVLRVNENQKGVKVRDNNKKLRELGWSRTIWNVAK